MERFAGLRELGWKASSQQDQLAILMLLSDHWRTAAWQELMEASSLNVPIVPHLPFGTR